MTLNEVLARFPNTYNTTWTEKVQAIQSPAIEQVISYALGPQGTNIHQAAKGWQISLGIENKSKIELVETPEIGLEKARELHDTGTLPIFWTCAVFARLYRLFFEHPEGLPFFFSYEMPLDEMQLASNPVKAEGIMELIGKKRDLLGVRVASHVSPAPLLNPLVEMGAEVVDAQSNAQAAEMCRDGEVEACITTQAGQSLYELETLHIFGSPPMIFFGGITQSGANLLLQTRR